MKISIIKPRCAFGAAKQEQAVSEVAAAFAQYLDAAKRPAFL